MQATAEQAAGEPAGGPADEPDWCIEAREAMYRATIEEARQRFGTEDPLFNYRWEHVLAVHTLAMKLARMTGADLEIVEAAVWLHDIRKDAGKDHPQEGAAFARQFLPQTDFPPEKIVSVARVIEDHMGLWRDEPLQSLESQVLWDADKLAKLGLTAAFHWLGMDFSGGGSRTLAELITRMRDADWQDKTVESMHSDASRQAARERLAAFEALWQGLEGELSGRDLEI